MRVHTISNFQISELVLLTPLVAIFYSVSISFLEPPLVALTIQDYKKAEQI